MNDKDESQWICKVSSKVGVGDFVAPVVNKFHFDIVTVHLRYWRKRNLGIRFSQRQRTVQRHYHSNKFNFARTRKAVPRLTLNFSGPWSIGWKREVEYHNWNERQEALGWRVNDLNHNIVRYSGQWGHPGLEISI